MRLAEYLESDPAEGNTAALMIRFVPDADRSRAEWDRLRAALVASHVRVGQVPPPPEPSAMTLKEQIMNDVRALLFSGTGDFNDLLNQLRAELLSAVPTTYEWNKVIGRPVAYPPTDHTHPANQITGLSGLFASKADLVGGVVADAQIPGKYKRVRFEVSSQAAMLALGANIADFAVRADQDGAVYQLTASNPALLSAWVLIRAPGGASVSTVNGMTGTVVLTAADVGAAPSGHALDRGNPHAVTKDQVGLGNLTNDAQVKRSEMGQPGGVATLGPDGKLSPGQGGSGGPGGGIAGERVTVSTPPRTYNPAQSAEDTLTLPAGRVYGVSTRVTGMSQGAGDRVTVSVYSQGAPGAYAELAYKAQFGMIAGVFQVTDDAQAWVYRDLAGGETMRVRTESQGVSPTGPVSVSFVMETF